MAGGAGGFPLNPPKSWKNDAKAPQNYKEVLILQLEMLLVACQKLTGGASREGFMMDQLRLQQGIGIAMESALKFIESIEKTDFDDLSASI